MKQLTLEIQRGNLAGKRIMPKKSAIREYWAEWLVSIDKFDSTEEALERDYCFGCGMDFFPEKTKSSAYNYSTSGGNTERAHILARTSGGSDEVSNMWLLCSDCHLDFDSCFTHSHFNTIDYMAFAFEWLKQRTFYHVLEKVTAQYGTLLKHLDNRLMFAERK